MNTLAMTLKNLRHTIGEGSLPDAVVSVCRDDPAEPRHLLDLSDLLYGLNLRAEAAAVAEELLRHPGASSVLRARAHERRADEAFLRGDLAAAQDADVMSEWAGLGYYARARNLLKCARAVASDFGGRFPNSVEGLQTLPGIGPYTAAAIASIAFDRRATVVDGNVERVVARLYAVETPLPLAKPELSALADSLTPDMRPGDHAQAMMDLGATICTPRNPACGICPWRDPCRARAADVPQLLPARRAYLRRDQPQRVQTPPGRAGSSARSAPRFRWPGRSRRRGTSWQPPTSVGRRDCRPDGSP